MSPRPLLIAAALALSSAAVSAAAEREVPPYRGFVNDLAGKMTPDERAALEDRLKGYAAKTSVEVAILMVPSLDGDDPAAYATRVGETWGVGKKEKDNGVVIFYAEQERKYFIATGRGAEAVLPDAIVSRIGREELKPKIRRQTYAALSAALDRIEQAVGGEYKAEDESSARGGMLIIALIVAAVFCLVCGIIHPVVGGFAGAVSGALIGAFVLLFGGLGIVGLAVVGFVIGLILKPIFEVVASGDFSSGGGGGGGGGGGSGFSFGGGNFGGGGAGGGAD